jgi:uncharacterized membrane protein YccC
MSPAPLPYYGPIARADDPPRRAALAAAAETVGAGPALPGERGTLRALVEQGEWVRLELAALSRSDMPDVNGTLGAAARALDAIAAGSDPAPSLTDLARSARGIGEPAARRWAVSLVEWIAAAGRQSHAGPLGAAPRRHPLHVLRAELTLRSSAFRHAARLSVALVVAGIVYRGLSLGSGYWVPLTVLFVLKPDYGTTMARGIGRAAGTMAGVTIAWAIVTLFSPAPGAIVALLALLACVAYAVFPANYALFSVVLTVLIALLAEFSGGSPVGALLDRIVDTAAGTAIALGAITLDNSFHEICSSLQSGAWLVPALPCDQTPAAGGHDQALGTVAAETASVLAALEQLEQTWRVSA